MRRQTRNPGQSRGLQYICATPKMKNYWELPCFDLKLRDWKNSVHENKIFPWKY